MSVEVIEGDAREVLPALIPIARRRGRDRVVVMTDPPWVQCEHVDIAGADNPLAVWRPVARVIPKLATRLVLHLGSLVDPRPMLGAVPKRMPYFGQARLRYFPPMFRGHATVDCEIAYLFGHQRQHLPTGAPVFRACCNATEHRNGRAERSKLSHPCPRNLEHVRWLVRWYCAQADLVIDPFCGSGTTLVVCAELGIDAIGIDSDPRWIPEARARVDRAESQQLLPGVR